jgi:hypothetical protein
MKNHFEAHDIDSALSFLSNFEKLSSINVSNIKMRKVKEVKCKKVKTVK